ncbi:MAG: Uma2 family endonuclease [Kofleriaceae bacterium]
MAAVPKRTVDDLIVLGADSRSELYDGEIVPKAMSGPEHSFAQGNLTAWLVRRFQRAPGERWPGGWWIAPELHVIYSSTTVYCHDLVGWRRDRLPERPTGGWIETRPDWVCEVLSPSHEKRDLVDKLSSLHAAGVPNYWVLDREKRILFLYRHDARAYLVRSVAAGEAIHAEPFEQVALRTGILFGDEDDDE